MLRPKSKKIKILGIEDETLRNISFLLNFDLALFSCLVLRTILMELCSDWSYCDSGLSEMQQNMLNMKMTYKKMNMQRPA
jgi:hypothetical protein